MTSETLTRTDPQTRSDRPSLAVAGQIIEAVAVRDFDAVVGALTHDVVFRALLPGRVLDVKGRPAVRSAFETWFGGAERWDMVEAVVGEVGGRVYLRWRLRLTHSDRRPGGFLVEQQVYADSATDGRLRDVALLCSGYRPEAS